MSFQDVSSQNTIITSKIKFINDMNDILMSSVTYVDPLKSSYIQINLSSFFETVVYRHTTSVQTNCSNWKVLRTSLCLQCTTFTSISKPWTFIYKHKLNCEPFNWFLKNLSSFNYTKVSKNYHLQCTYLF